MPVRATKRGAARTGLDGAWDVVVCGASFGGLAVARELRDAGARVLVLDRYEIGERPTSACATPTRWLQALGVEHTRRQTFEALVCHLPSRTLRFDLPYSFSTFDYEGFCAGVWSASDAVFETALVRGRSPGRHGEHVVHTDRGDVRARLLVDALGWRRVLGRHVQPPGAPLSRGLEIHPAGRDAELAIWVDPAVIPAGYGWSFPAGDELRVGVGSYDPREHVRAPTERLAERGGLPAVRFQGNWIPHRMRPAVEDGVFFVGDSAGHCLPLTAEGIRTALFFGARCGRELRAVLAGRQHRSTALARYHAFCLDRAWKFAWLLAGQRAVPRLPPRLLAALLARLRPRTVERAFRHYERVAPAPGASAAAAGLRMAVPAAV